MLEPQEVVVKDVQMKFGSMVVFIMKWTLAAIPAMLLLALVAGLIGAVFASVFGGGGDGGGFIAGRVGF